MANYNINSRLYNGKGENNISNNNTINKSNIYKFSNFTGIMFLLLVLVNYSLSHGSENKVFVFPGLNYFEASKLTNRNWAKNKEGDTTKKPPAFALEVVKGNINDKFKIANVRCKIEDNKIVQLDNISSLNIDYLGFGKKKYAIFAIITKEKNRDGHIVFSDNIYVYSSDINSLTHDIPYYDRGIFSNKNNLSQDIPYYDRCILTSKNNALSQVKVIACDTHNVIDMNSMFYNCNSLTILDLSKFNTSNVTDMSLMFYKCSSLKELNLSNFNTSKVENMNWMFAGCSSLTELDLSNFNTNKVTNMIYNMFANCFTEKETSILICKASTIQKITNNKNSRLTITENVNNINALITNKDNQEQVYTCSVERKKKEIKPQITVVEKYDKEKLKIKNMPKDGKIDDIQIVSKKFSKANLVKYVQIGSGEDKQELEKIIENIDIVGQTHLSAYVEVEDNGTVKLRCFIHCTNANSITDKYDNYYGLFRGSAATKIVILSCGNNITNMRDMFVYCSSLTELDLSNWETENVTDMNGMFYCCNSLKNLDLSKFNTTNVTNMRSMFCSCSSLTELDLSKFKTDNVTDMTGMFNECSSLKTLNLSNFNTSNVTNMFCMFAGCSSLTKLDLSNFNTENVKDMSGMFYECFTEEQPSTLICKASTLKKITENENSSLTITENVNNINALITNKDNLEKVYTCTVERLESEYWPQITSVVEYKQQQYNTKLHK